MAGIVIIGAGECGVRAAFALREKGYQGPVTLLGEESHLPYERPPLSKTYPPVKKAIAAEGAYASAGIDLCPGVTVVGIDPSSKTVTLADRREIAFRQLLIATGARPRVFSGMEGARTLRTADDAETILSRLAPGRRLIIVGGGLIGLELASTARRCAVDVLVVEAADRMMARAVPKEVAAVAQVRHRREAVDLRLSTIVKRACADHVELHAGTMIEGDMVVAATGSVAETRLAEAAGLTVENGIRVDEFFRTSAPDVFAAGDCCSFPWRGRHVRLESWRAAQDHGNHVAATMLGACEPYDTVPWFWSDQYDLTLQVAGLAEPDLPFVRRDLGDGAFILFQLEGDRLVSASGIGVGNSVARDIRLAEMLIKGGSVPGAAALADPSVKLKSLLNR